MRWVNTQLLPILIWSYATLESDIHLGFASVNISVLGLTNSDVNLKRMHQLYIDSHIAVYIIMVFVSAETAQMLARNVNYEVPALKKQIAKCQQIQKVIIFI